MFDRYQAMIERHKTSDLSDLAADKGNIAGGLTTIEEKALGNIQKITYLQDRRRARQGRSADHPGLWFMDYFVRRRRDGHALRRRFRASSHFFLTGQGNDRQPDPAGDQDLSPT